MSTSQLPDNEEAISAAVDVVNAAEVRWRDQQVAQHSLCPNANRILGWLGFRGVLSHYGIVNGAGHTITELRRFYADMPSVKTCRRHLNHLSRVGLVRRERAGSAYRYHSTFNAGPRLVAMEGEIVPTGSLVAPADGQDLGC